MFGKAFINEKETVLTSVLTGLQGGLQSEDQLTSLHVEESNLAVSEGCDQVCWIAADQVHWRGDPQLWHTATEAVVRKANITGGIKKLPLTFLLTLVLIEYCKGGGGGVGVPQLHCPVRRAGQEALVSAAVD